MRITITRFVALAFTLGLSVSACGSQAGTDSAGAPSSSSETSAVVKRADSETLWSPAYLKDAFSIIPRYQRLSTPEMVNASSEVLLGEYVAVEAGVNLFPDDPGGDTIFFTMTVTESVKGSSQPGETRLFGVLRSGADIDQLRRSIPVGTPILLFGDTSRAMTEAGRPDVITPYNSSGFILGNPGGIGTVRPLIHEVNPTGVLESLLP